MRKFDVLATDTFCGIPNYSWTERAVIEVPDDAKQMRIVRAARAAIGSGGRCVTYDLGDCLQVEISSKQTVIFIHAAGGCSMRDKMTWQEIIYAFL